MNLKDLETHEVESLPENVEQLQDFEVENLPEESIDPSEYAETIGTKLAQGATMGLGKIPVAAAMATIGPQSAEEEEFEKTSAKNVAKQTGAAIQKLESKISSEKNPEKLEFLMNTLEQLKSQKSDLEALPKEKSWIKDYYEAKKGLKERELELEEKHPVLSAASELAGGVSTLGLGGALAPAKTILGTVGKSALTGGAMGAATGFGEGESRLLEGEIGDTLGETAEGIKTGAALGAALPVGISAVKGVAKGVGSLAKKIPIVEEFLEGQKFARETGKELSKESVTEAGRKSAEDIYDTLRDIQLKYGQKIGNIETMAGEKGATVNAADRLRSMRENIEKSVNIPAEEKQNVLTFIDKQLGEFETKKVAERAEKSALKKIEEGREGVLVSEPEIVGGRPVSRIEEPGKTTALIGKEEIPGVGDTTHIQRAKELKKQLEPFTRSQNFELSTAAKEAMGVLNRDIENAVNLSINNLKNPNELEKLMNTYKDTKTVYTNIKAAMEKAGLDSSKIGEFRDIADVDTLHRLLIGQGRASDLTRTEMINLMKRSPEMRNAADDIYRELEKANKWEDLFAGTEAGGKSTGIKDIFLELRRKAATLGSSYELGKKNAAKKFQDEFKDNFNETVAGKLFSATADQITDLANKISQNGKYQTYANTLQKIAQAPEGRRATLLYGLYQQPGFREAVNDTIPGEENESVNP